MKRDDMISAIVSCMVGVVNRLIVCACVSNMLQSVKQLLNSKIHISYVIFLHKRSRVKFWAIWQLYWHLIIYSLNFWHNYIENDLPVDESKLQSIH